MPSISKCPKCNRDVTIPDGVESQASVRCPLCSAIYPIGEAEAKEPPALIPIAMPPTQSLKSESDHLLKSDLGEGSFHTPDADEAETTDDSDSTDEASETDEADAESEGLVTAEPLSSELREPARIDAWEKVDETPEINSGTDAERHDGVDTAAFAGFAEEDPDAPGKIGPPTGNKPRPKKKQKSAAKEIGGAIIGGFVGLAVGYYGLNYFGGEKFDFLKIPLPGVAHTQKHKNEPAADEPKPSPPNDRSAQDPPRPKPMVEPGPEEQPEPPTDASLDIPAEPPTVVDLSIDPEPEPEPLPDGYVGLREPPSFGSDELGQALKAANESIVVVTGSETLPAEAFEKFCRLGQVATFVEGDPSDGRLQDRKQAIRGILQRLADTPRRIDEIGTQAGRLIDGDGAGEPGILLAGTARSVVSQGGLHGMTVQLAVRPSSVSVLSDRPFPFDSGDRVVILGSVVTDPAEKLVGYGGTKPKIIWAGMAVKARR